MADWFAVHRIDDGELISVGTLIASPLRSGLAAINLGTRPPAGLWNTTTLQFDPKPPPLPDVDRIDEFMTRMARVLVGADEVAVRAELVNLLADNRFRDDSDPYEIER